MEIWGTGHDVIGDFNNNRAGGQCGIWELEETQTPGLLFLQNPNLWLGEGP